jgi:DNA-binding transcriptional MerR regulator
VKFYLREGLLPPGRRTSATQAVYDDEHLARLRLVRALTETGGLSLSRVRAVLDGLDAPTLFEAVGCAHGALSGDPGEVDTAEAARLVHELGWTVHDASPALAALARALGSLADVGMAMTADQVETYARAAEQVAATDVAHVPTDSATDAVTTVVLGTVLREPVLLALRRLAQESRARRQWADVGRAGR